VPRRKKQQEPAIDPLPLRSRQRLPVPTAGYVLGLYRVRMQLGDEATLRSDIYDMRALTTMTNVVPIPNAYQAIAQTIRAPFVRDSWLRIVAALTQNPAVGQAEGRDETQDARRSAEIAQRWTMAAMRQMQRPAGDEVPYDSIKALVRDQEGIIKVVHRPDAYANFPARESDEAADVYLKRTDDYRRSRRKLPPGAVHLPFAWRTIDRLQMLFGEGEFGDDWALEYGEYPRAYLGQHYGMVETRDGLVDPEYLIGGSPKPESWLQSSTGRTIKYEFFNRDWWAVVIDGAMAPGWPKRNPYSPWLPYFRAKVNESTLMALKFLAPALDALLTMHLNWAYLSAYPNPVVYSTPNNQFAPGLALPIGASDEPGQLRWVPGKAFEMPEGRDIRFLVPPPAGQDLAKMESMLRDLIDVAGVPSVFRGVGGSDQAGYAINQLIAAANLTYKILATVGQQQLASVGKFLWWLVEHRINGPDTNQAVYVLDEGDDDTRQWLGLRPRGKPTTTEAGIEYLADYQVKFRPVLPTDEQARAMMASQLVNTPKQMISKRYALEHYLQVDDPDGMMDDIWVESAMDNDPNINQQVVNAALKRAGLGQQGQSPILGPNGQPMQSGGPPNGYPPGQAAAGTPVVPGLNQPAAPGPPGPPAIAGGRGTPGAPGGRPGGMFPGGPGTPVAGA